MSPRGVALALCLGALARAASASACDARDRDAAITRANALRAGGDPDGALTSLRALWARCPEARVLVHMALAEHSAGRWFDAWRHMTDALATAGDAWIDARRPVIERARDLCREHLASVTVDVDAPGATVSIDGGEPRTLPLAAPLVFAAGSITLEVRAPGHLAARRAVTAAEGAALRERFTLAPERLDPPALAPPAREPPPTPAAAGVALAPDAPPRAGALRYVGVAVAALGAAAAGFGVYQWARTGSLGDSLAGASWDGAEPYAGARLYLDRTGAAGFCDRAAAARAGDPAAAQASSLCDQHGAAQAMALGFGLGGVALAGAGVAMILLGGPRRASAPAARVTFAPWLAAGAGGATAAARF